MFLCNAFTYALSVKHFHSKTLDKITVNFMRVLIILHKAKKKGGAVLQIIQLSEALKKQGYDVLVFSLDTIPTTKNYIKNLYLSLKLLRKVIIEFNPSIIFTSDPFITTSVALVTRKAEIPIVVRIGAVYDAFYAARFIEKTLSGTIENKFYPLVKKSLNILARVILRKINLVVFNSNFLKNNYLNDVSNSIVIHNGVRCNLSYNPSEAQVRENRLIKLVYVGRIEPSKSIELIIEALELLTQKDINFEFCLIGNVSLYPVYWDKISKMITQYELWDKILLLDEICHNNLPTILKKHDILLFPTDDRNFPITEGLPNVVLEGMANGLAIIATPVAGLPEIIKRGNGFLVKPNPHEFAYRIELLYNDEKELAKIKEQNVSDAIKLFSFDKTSKSYIRAFKTLLSRI